MEISVQETQTQGNTPPGKIINYIVLGSRESESDEITDEEFKRIIIRHFSKLKNDITNLLNKAMVKQAPK